VSSDPMVQRPARPLPRFALRQRERTEKSQMDVLHPTVEQRRPRKRPPPMGRTTRRTSGDVAAADALPGAPTTARPRNAPGQPGREYQPSRDHDSHYNPLTHRYPGDGEAVSAPSSVRRERTERTGAETVRRGRRKFPSRPTTLMPLVEPNPPSKSGRRVGPGAARRYSYNRIFQRYADDNREAGMQREHQLHAYQQVTAAVAKAAHRGGLAVPTNRDWERCNKGDNPTAHRGVSLPPTSRVQASMQPPISPIKTTARARRPQLNPTGDAIGPSLIEPHEPTLKNRGYSVSPVRAQWITNRSGETSCRSIPTARGEFSGSTKVPTAAALDGPETKVAPAPAGGQSPSAFFGASSRPSARDLISGRSQAPGRPPPNLARGRRPITPRDRFMRVSTMM